MKKPLNISQDQLQELDRKLHEMALLNFEMFCKMAGINKQQAYVCFEIYKGKSVRQIGISLKLGKSWISAISQKCPENQGQNLK